MRYFFEELTLERVAMAIIVAAVACVMLFFLSELVYRAIDAELRGREISAQKVPVHIRMLQEDRR